MLVLTTAVLSGCHESGGGGSPSNPSEPPGPTFDGFIGIGPNSFSPSHAMGIPVDGGRMSRLFGLGSRGIADFVAVHCETDGSILAIAATTNELVELDRTTGRATSRGPLAPGVIEDMTVRDGTVWYTDNTRDALVGIDLDTGAETVFPFGFFDVRGLAWHAALDRFFACDLITDQLLSVDPTTGDVTVIGPCDTDYFSYDAATQTLWLRNGTVIRTIDPSTAALGPSDSFTPSSSGGFTFDPLTGNFLHISTSNGTRLVGWNLDGNTQFTVPLEMHNVVAHTVLGDGTLLVRGSSFPTAFFRIDRTTGHWSPDTLFTGGSVPALTQVTYDAVSDKIFGQAAQVLHESAPPYDAFTSLGSVGIAFNGGIAADGGSGSLFGAVNTQIRSISIAPPTTTIITTHTANIEGLSRGPTPGLLHVLNGNGTVFDFDIANATLSPSQVSFRGTMGVLGNGLSYDAATEEFISFTDRIVVRAADGRISSPGTWPFQTVRAIARDGDTGEVYLFAGGTLFKLGPNFDVEYVGPSSTITCASYDTSRDLIAGFLGSSFVRVSPETGVANGVTTSGGVIVALEYDALLDIYWGIDSFNHELVRIDPIAGWYAPVGPLGTNDVRGLALDPDSRRLYGVDATSGRPLEIDTTTGAATPIGPPGWVPSDAIWGR